MWQNVMLVVKIWDKNVLLYRQSVTLTSVLKDWSKDNFSVCWLQNDQAKKSQKVYIKSVLVKKSNSWLSEHTWNDDIFNKSHTREERFRQTSLYKKEKLFLEWKELKMTANSMLMVHWMPADNPNVIKVSYAEGTIPRWALGWSVNQKQERTDSIKGLK